ncbi:hypothetical protein F4801DRAFT_583659 [Xylaria longipes]|nr:hypothetical protein F4801DRAFT_583659 [Xylaria longipes]
MAVTALTYYLPFCFQASKGPSLSEGGTYLLALAVPNSFFSIICGAAMTMTGFYTPWPMVGGNLFSIGSSLLFTLDQSSGTPKIVGYWFLANACFGFGVQLPLMAMQNVLPQADVLAHEDCDPVAFRATVGSGDLQQVKSLLDKSTAEDRNALVTEKGHNGATALHRAVLGNYPDIANLLINNVTDQNGYIVANDNSSMAALHDAARANSRDTADLLIKNVTDHNGYIVAKDNSGMTALHYAATAKAGDTALYLLNKGANPALEDGWGSTVWDIAVRMESWEVMAALMLKEPIDKAYQHLALRHKLLITANNMVSVNAQLCTIARAIRGEHDSDYISIDLIKVLGVLLRQVHREFHENREAPPQLRSREPSCIVQALGTTGSEDDKPKEFISLVMPFIHVDDVTFKNREDEYAGQTQHLKFCVSKRRKFLEGYMPLTLDEYCSPALSQNILKIRNHDQVLGRYEKSRRERDNDAQIPPGNEKEAPSLLDQLWTIVWTYMTRLRYLINPGRRKKLNDQPPAKAMAGEDLPPTNTVFVRQAWIWKIGDHIITNLSDEIIPLHSFMRLRDQEPCLSIALLLGDLLELFDNPAREAPGPLLKIYENALSVISEDVNQYVKSALIEDIDLEREKDFIHQISDLREELSMIKSVLAEQEEVWKEFTGLMWPNQGPDQQPGDQQPGDRRNTRDPTSVGSEQSAWSVIGDKWFRELWRTQSRFNKYRRRISKLEQDAERVERNISTQLDLKQKHAAMKEAHSTAVISAAVFGFTIITIIFAPLSFVAALFALPIDEFNKGKKGNEADGVYSSNYIGKWSATAELVSIAITLVAMWAALRFADLHIWGKKGMREWIRQKANEIREAEKQSRPASGTLDDGNDTADTDQSSDTADTYQSSDIV